MTITVNMPQMAANGLSENWLFKFCGDLHWQALCQALSTTSSQLESEAGDRLYASFIAISARYSQPLSAVRENDVLEESAEVGRYGTSFFHSRVSLAGPTMRFEQELITAFVARSGVGRNDLRKTAPAARFAFAGNHELVAPALLNKSALLRKGVVPTYVIDGITVELEAPRRGLEEGYSPSPYVDYNGANLLYYAAYPSIFDTLERRLVQRHWLVEDLGRDWALVSSTVARDIFYYRNLDIGESVVVRLEHFQRLENRAVLHSTLRRRV